MRRLLLLALPLAAAAQDGAALFERHCAACHRAQDGNRAPLPEAMRALSPAAVLRSLESGTMREQGKALSTEERTAVARFTGRGSAERLDTAAPAGQCAAGVVPRTDSTFWNGWSPDRANSRFQPAGMAGLAAADLARLKLKWAFGIPGANTAIAQPALVGGVLYFGSQSGAIYALDAATGCTYWTFQADAMVRTAMLVAPIQSGRYALLFGDAKAQVYALDIPTRKLRWKTRVDDHPWARLTGAPALYEGRLYVPISSNEEVPAGNPQYECCTFRGSVAALDEETGKILWKTHTITAAPQPTRKSAAGTQLRGPAGGAVWSAPTIDARRNALYVGTGNGYSDPSAETTDAVLALDLDSGKLLWHAQLARDDNWTFACMSPNRANCPEKSGPDHDIGASPLLREIGGGKRVLVAGQKSGMVYGLDPDAQGKTLWQQRLGKGSALGGIMWGMAADARAVYVPLSDHLTDSPGGLFALRPDNGERLWQAPPIAPACKGRRGCTAAQMAAATAIPGAIFSGSMDGHLRAYAADDGRLLWDFDTLREFAGVNGVAASGGSLNGPGAVVAGRMVFVNSGYGLLGGMPGNALLAFGVD